jgi:SPP1 gp7 family putative phage head morphogenesis protein
LKPLPSGFFSDPVPHDEAADYIRAKTPMFAGQFNELLPELRARAFTIAGVECADTLQRCRDAIATLPAGGDWNKIKKELVNEICPWLVDPNADAETQARQTKAAKARATLLLRIHGGQAYGATNARVLDENQDIFPFRQYLSMDDSRVRASHAALHNKILPADSPWWHTHTPPWEFGCRCTVAGISAEEAGEIAAAESHKPPEQRDVLEGAQLHELVHNNRLVSGPNEIYDTRTGYQKNGKGYEWDHRSMQMPLEMIQARYDAPVWEAFQAWADATDVMPGSTVLDWAKMSGPARPPESPGELLASRRASVPVAIAAKLLGANPEHPAAKAVKLWGDDQRAFSSIIHEDNRSHEAEAWRKMIEQAISVLEPVEGDQPLFRGWQFPAESARDAMMAAIESGRPWIQERAGMSATFSMQVAMSEKYIGGKSMASALWVVDSPVSARDMRPIFTALGTNYHTTDEEAIFPKKSMFVLTGKSVMMHQDKSGHEKPVVVYSVREVTP